MELEKIYKETFREYLELCKDIDTYIHRKILLEDGANIDLSKTAYRAYLDLSQESNYLVEYMSGDGKFIHIDEFSFYFLETLFYNYPELLEKIRNFSKDVQFRFLEYLVNITETNRESDYVNSILEKHGLKKCCLTQGRTISNICYLEVSGEIMVSLLGKYGDYVYNSINVIWEFLKLGKLYYEEK